MKTTWLLPICGCLLAWGMVLSHVTRSQEPGPRADKPVATEKVDDPDAEKSAEAKPADGTLAGQQEQVAQRFRDLERLLLRMAELTAPTDPRRAALLRRAVAQSKDRDIDHQLDALVQLLRQERLAAVLKNQGEVHDDLVKLLELLLSEDRSKRIESEKEQVRKYLERVNKLIKEQRAVQGETQRDGEAKELAERQENLSEKTGKLADDLKEKDAAAQPLNAKDKDDKEGKPDGEQKPSEGKDKAQDGKSKDGDSKDSDSKDSPDKPGTDKDDASKSSEQKDQKQKDKEQKDKEQKQKDGKQSDEDKENQDGKDKDGKSKKSKDADAPKDGDQKPGQSQDTPPVEPPMPSPGEQGQPSEGSQSQQQEQQQQEQNPAQQRLQNAQKRMQEAQKKLEEAKKSDAVEKQEEALKELEQAKADLEEILRQLREEEMARTLAMLEVRFRKMLESQIEVYEGTQRLDKVPQNERQRDEEIEAGRLSRKERQIMLEAEKALDVLRQEGSAVALPEAVEEMRDDMRSVADMLSEVKVGEMTQGIEKDIIAALEEMIAALDKAQKDREQKQQQSPQQQQAGGENETPLVDQLAELKMIRALQMRVNLRTKRFADMTKTEQVDQPEILAALRQLAEREQRIHKVTRDIVVGRNR